MGDSNFLKAEHTGKDNKEQTGKQAKKLKIAKIKKCFLVCIFQEVIFLI